MGTHVLAGDVGGTNVRLALFRRGGALEPEALEVLPCKRYGGLAEVLRDYLGRRGGDVSEACMGVAGVIQQGRVDFVNLGWSARDEDLAAELGLDRVSFVNDLEANAHGIEALGPSDFRELNAGEEDASGNRCLVSAGTGLGEAGLLRTCEGWIPFHSEGGHADFAPRNAEETDLLSYLMGRFGRVSWERVLSGPGIANLEAFLRDTGRAEEPAWLAEKLRAGDPARAIASAALSGAADICARALGLFVSAYGAEAGNMALKLMATGGVYLGGGIAPKILPKLEDGAFLRSFLEKGRLRPVLEKIPVRVILNELTALLGAARVALGVSRRRLSPLPQPA